MNEINQMTPRSAMGLPKRYQSSLLEHATKHIKLFKNKSCDELINILSSQTFSLDERWSAGTILALFGDPRIDAFNPTMLDISAGKVIIGSTIDEIEVAHKKYERLGVKKEWLLKEYPKHEVEVKAYKMAKYLITNYEYLTFLKDTGHVDIPSSWRFGIYDPTKANHPVYGVLPESADSYVNWLSNKTGRYFRLPNEYEWEYVAAGGSRNEFPWGDEFSPDKANTLEAGIYSTTPIGMFHAGAPLFGCMDMAGNVEEYTANNYFPYPNGKFIEDDLGMNYRVSRGGSFTRNADLARCRRRHGFLSSEIYAFGFRLAENVYDQLF
jgi:toxoflavin biosynthesis protein ToxD